MAIDKPTGFHVHPPEDSQHRVPRDLICLYHVRNQLKQHVYPVHRLDAGTSGVLVFALSSADAGNLCRQFAEREVQKTYRAVVRGYVEEQGHIDLPLELDSTGDLVEAQTSYRRLGQVEFPFAVSKRFQTSRYSLVEVRPHTGRWHQIRRHFNRISHPLVGDPVHGDSRHNQFFREHLGIRGLCLRAERLEFRHPANGERILLETPSCERWLKLQSFFERPTGDFETSLFATETL